MRDRGIMIVLLVLVAASVGIAVESGAIGPRPQDSQAAAASCSRGAAGLLPPALPGQPQPTAPSAAPPPEPRAFIGKAAPNFEAMGLVGGEFKPVRLSDYKGKWVLLCFYPGDFTFV